MTENIGVGIIGYGYAASTFHVPLIQTVPGLRLIAISSSTPEKIQAALPTVEGVRSPKVLFARPDIDLIIIPTPNETHFPLAKEALAAGKHVVVDKPFTLTVAEAQQLKFQAEKTGCLLAAFHNRRWDTDFLTLKHVLTTGELGRIVHFESHFDRYRPLVQPRWRERPGAGAGLWFDLGSHLLDQALQLFGYPDSIQLDLAMQRQEAQVDDWFHAVLHYGSMRAILHAGALVPFPAPRLVVHGDRGSFIRLEIDPQENALKGGRSWTKADPGSAELILWDKGVRTCQTISCLPGDYSVFYVQIREALHGRGGNPVPVDDAIQTMSLLELGLKNLISTERSSSFTE